MTLPDPLIAEFSPQSGVLLAWPHHRSDWRDQLTSIEPVYLTLVESISRYEPVQVICLDREHRDHVEPLLHPRLASGADVRFIEIPTNDIWVRDYGPLCRASAAGVALLDFVFDGWGNKYPAELDNRVTARLQAAACLGQSPLEQAALVLEGGAIETDGAGTLLATSRCLLHSGRNPALDRPALERALAAHLGVDRFLWLDHGYLEGDDTDGHVDMLARFCSPRDIAYTACADESDAHFPALTAMEQQLRTFADRDGQPYRLHALPLPRPVYAQDGNRLPASYANFLIINGAVLMPAYDDAADAEAAAILQRLFPERNVIPVDCRPLIQQSGALHCATLQLAAGVLPA